MFYISVVYFGAYVLRNVFNIFVVFLLKKSEMILFTFHEFLYFFFMNIFLNSILFLLNKYNVLLNFLDNFSFGEV
jgi:hypothetical protein